MEDLRDLQHQSIAFIEILFNDTFQNPIVAILNTCIKPETNGLDMLEHPETIKKTTVDIRMYRKELMQKLKIQIFKNYKMNLEYMENSTPA